jgi:hypothetical protein
MRFRPKLIPSATIVLTCRDRITLTFILTIMKRMILSAALCVFALATAGTAVVSCEKSENLKPTAACSKKPGHGAVEKIMPPNATVTNLAGICGGITCAGPGFALPSKNNYIRMTKDAYTIANYPANMRYTIYLKGTHISGNLYNIGKVAEFSCTQNAPEYASSILNNTTQYYLRLTDAAGSAPPANDVIDITTPSPAIPFVTANYKGQPC